MTDIKQINELRKAGKLDEADKLCEQYLSENQQNIWGKRAKAWILYDYSKKYAVYSDRDLFFKYIEEIIDLQLSEDEHLLYNSLAWAIRSMVADSISNQCSDMSFYDRLFELMQKIPFTKSSDSYSILLQAFLSLKKEWGSFEKFCMWWDFGNFQEKDYLPTVASNGKSILSLAERAFLSYSKSLLNKDDVIHIEKWIPRLELIVSQHPDYIYLYYYLTKSLIRIGENARAIQSLLPFIKKKRNDFWVWELLGDAYSDSENKFICYCKAMDCQGKEEMTIALREKMAAFLLKRGMYDESKTEFVKIKEIRDRNRWKIGKELNEYMNSKAIEDASISTKNRDLYKEKGMEAEALVFGSCNKYVVLITYVNVEKHICSFITQERKSGFFKYKSKDSSNIVMNNVIIISALELSEDKPTVVKSISTEVSESDKSQFIKIEIGCLSVSGKGFGFVKNIYIDSQLIRGMKEGENLTVTAVPSYDKGKHNWGWRAIKVER